MKKLLISRRGSALVTVMAVLTVIVVLGVAFASIAFYSYSATNGRIKTDSSKVTAKSVVEAAAEELADGGGMLEELSALNSGAEWKIPLIGSFSSKKLGSGLIGLRYLASDKRSAELSAEYLGEKYAVTLSLTQKSRIVTRMEKIYSNAFFFQGADYWSGDMKITGNIYLNGDCGLHIGAMDGVHNGDVICAGNLDLNENSTIYGDVTVSGDLFLSDKVTVEGNVVCGGNATVASGCTVKGRITVGGDMVLYGKVIGTAESSGYIDVYTNSRVEGSARCGGFRMWGGGIGADDKKLDGIITGTRTVTESVTVPKLPEKLEAQSWEIPDGSERILPNNNVVGKSGRLLASDLSKNSDIIFDTSAGDLHISLIADYFDFSHDMIIKGEGRVFVYLSGMMRLTGYIGKKHGFDSSDHPDKCSLFVIGTGADTLNIADDGRFDGYVYLTAGEFYASGRGIAVNGGRQYKIVGSVVAKLTGITDDLGGEIVFARPDLDGIIFDEVQYTETDLYEVWEISGFGG